ncbi:hypothetical protein DWQ65_08135 [Treponema phagedenis]|uniref:Uncharacterized protein n=1 Tax=Treponema phagedenis TaxID=162 RepID=A0AAE6M9C7_TREPH|nr:hypothetical protein FUT82_14145 [Treponema phagedenis]QEK10183.1 hypothetical protein FUT81_12590 [Treponema phagedenis]QSH94411.1 hypothetical protein C5O78_05040 [Treponema phagedenis]QSI00031.1 hypothetical protein DWQ65_08135 [Treponema phagedenis]
MSSLPSGAGVKGTQSPLNAKHTRNQPCASSTYNPGSKGQPPLNATHKRKTPCASSNCHPGAKGQQPLTISIPMVSLLALAKASTLFCRIEAFKLVGEAKGKKAKRRPCAVSGSFKK